MGFHPSALLRGTGVELSAIADLEARINLDQQIAIYQNAIVYREKAGLDYCRGNEWDPIHRTVGMPYKHRRISVRRCGH